MSRVTISSLINMKETTGLNATGSRLSDIQSMVEAVKQDMEYRMKNMTNEREAEL